jgi:SNF2 family DNA or RNA helicase
MENSIEEKIAQLIEKLENLTKKVEEINDFLKS